MIEINLVPDVKQQLITAQRQRTAVISIAILAALISAAAVVLLALYAFGVQGFMESSANDAIKERFGKLQQVKDLDKALTLQSQLSGVAESHQNAAVMSRLFQIRDTITPKDGSIKITKISVDRENSTISIEGEAAEGYKKLEAFKKTIRASSFEYRQTDAQDRVTTALTSAITDGTRNLTDDDNGKRILRFELSFEIPQELFSREVADWKMLPVKNENVTDSATDVPSSVLNGEGQ